MYQLSGTIELDAALVGSRQKGKCGRGAAGRNNVLSPVKAKIKKQDLLLWQ